MRAVIRIGGISDLDSLVELETRGFLFDRFDRGQYRYLLTRANSTVYILEHENRIAGTAVMLWRKNSSAGRLYNIVVDPEYHGRGFGKMLMEACERETVRRKLVEISLEVRVDNLSAIALYEKLGFKTAGLLKGYYSDNSNGLKMIKKLGSIPYR